MYCIYRFSGQNLTLGFILKIFLKFRKFQPRYSYKIYSYKKECSVIKQNVSGPILFYVYGRIGQDRVRTLAKILKYLDVKSGPRWRVSQGGPCSLVPFQNFPMFPCSHTLSECFRTVIFRNFVPCSQKLANVPLFPSIFCQCSLVPQNPWETLKMHCQAVTYSSFKNIKCNGQMLL